MCLWAFLNLPYSVTRVCMYLWVCLRVSVRISQLSLDLLHKLRLYSKLNYINGLRLLLSVFGENARSLCILTNLTRNSQV